MHLASNIALAGFAVIVAAGCRTGTVPRQTTLLASSHQAEVTEPRFQVPRIGLPQLSPAASSVPAKLKDSDYRRVSGDYAYVDLEEVLRLMGRIQGESGEVTRVRFFERIAASVTVGGTTSFTEYLCSKDTEGHWHVVGTRHWNY
jgi:hypothetical protein